MMHEQGCTGNKLDHFVDPGVFIQVCHYLHHLCLYLPYADIHRCPLDALLRYKNSHSDKSELCNDSLKCTD